MATKDGRTKLAAREIQVMLCLGDGLTARETGEQLAVGFETVRMYLKRVRDKTGLRRKVELAMFAVKHRGYLRRRLVRLGGQPCG